MQHYSTYTRYKLGPCIIKMPSFLEFFEPTNWVYLEKTARKAICMYDSYMYIYVRVTGPDERLMGSLSKATKYEDVLIAAAGSTLFLTFQFCVRSVVSAQSFAQSVYMLSRFRSVSVNLPRPQLLNIYPFRL